MCMNRKFICSEVLIEAIHDQKNLILELPKGSQVTSALLSGKNICIFSKIFEDSKEDATDSFEFCLISTGVFIPLLYEYLISVPRISENGDVAFYHLMYKQL